MEDINLLKLPAVHDLKSVGTYPLLVSSGGLRYDNVLEYRLYTKLAQGEMKMTPYACPISLMISYDTLKKKGIYTHLHALALVQQHSYYTISEEGEFVKDNVRYKLHKVSRISEVELSIL